MHMSPDEGNTFHSGWLEQGGQGVWAGCQLSTQLARLLSLVHIVDDAVSGALVSENWKLQRLRYLLLI